MKRRAFSLLRVKEVNDEQRMIEGVATTPTPDRVGDIVDPMGAQFAELLPLHLYHDSTKPVGTVKFGRPTRKGIPFTATLPKVVESGTVKDRVDEAWHSLKYKLLGAVSIGFRIFDDAVEYIEETGGFKFLKTEIVELSLVSIPANAEAIITGVKSFDDELRAALGAKRAKSSAAPNKSAGASATTKVTSPKEGRQMNIQDMIKEFENKRAALAASMEALMAKASDEGRTLDVEEEEEYENAATEVKSIDGHLRRLRETESLNVQKATRLPTGDAGDEGKASASRAPHVVMVDKKLKPGIEFARYAMCVGAAKGSLPQALEIARSRFPDSPRVATVLKAAVAGGTTTDATWAGPLVEYNQFAGDFVEFLRPQTIIGRFGSGGIPSLRSVPFNVNIRAQTSGGTGYWVGQGAPKPLTKADFTNVYLGWAKVANIAVLTEELLRFSNPSAEMLVRDTLAAALIERLDTDFVDPSKAAAANVSPASITNGVTPITASGTGTAANIRTDVKAAMTAFINANISPTAGVWIMPSTVALALSLMQNALGQPEYPNITMTGGTFFGLPVIASEYVGGDSTGSYVVLANASDIWLADDGQVVIDASREASLQMLDNPTNNSGDGTATTMVSMFQTNSVAMRAERWINWQKRRSAAVQLIDGVNWGA